MGWTALDHSISIKMLGDLQRAGGCGQRWGRLPLAVKFTDDLFGERSITASKARFLFDNTLAKLSVEVNHTFGSWRAGLFTIMENDLALPFDTEVLGVPVIALHAPTGATPQSTRHHAVPRESVESRCP